MSNLDLRVIEAENLGRGRFIYVTRSGLVIKGFQRRFRIGEVIPIEEIVEETSQFDGTPYFVVYKNREKEQNLKKELSKVLKTKTE